MLARQAFLRAAEYAGHSNAPSSAGSEDDCGEGEGATSARGRHRARANVMFGRSLIRPRAYSVRMLMTLKTLLGPAGPAIDAGVRRR
jgi:hypothetical protein